MQLAKISNKLTSTGKFRHCIEKCDVMINNDEIILVNTEAVLSAVARGHLVFSRPIFNEENGNEKITLALDAVYRFHQLTKYYELLKTLSDEPDNFTPSFILASLIGSNYYDCMSGGCPIMLLDLFYILTKTESIDKSSKVYPSPNQNPFEIDKWDTIQDFINEYERRFSIENQEAFQLILD